MLTEERMTTFTWNSGTTGDWFTSSDWTPAAVPGPSDDVAIQPSGKVIISTAIAPPDPPASAASLTVAAGANLELDALARLTIGGNFAIPGRSSSTPASETAAAP